MKSAAAGLVLTMAVLGGAGPPSALAGYVDQKRVLVISAPVSDDPELGRQDAALSGSSLALSQREVAIVRVVGPTARDERGALLAASDVRRAAGLSAVRFGVVLVGKDGGVKLRSNRAISLQRLLGAIDAMPMRQQEMRRRTPVSRPTSPAP